MKLNLNIKPKKHIELLCVGILIILIIHYTQSVSKLIEKNQYQITQIKSKNIQFKNKLLKYANPEYLIQEITNITKVKYEQLRTTNLTIYVYKTKITAEIVSKLTTVMSLIKNSHYELNINNISNTIELIIPKSS